MHPRTGNHQNLRLHMLGFVDEVTLPRWLCGDELLQEFGTIMQFVN